MIKIQNLGVFLFFLSPFFIYAEKCMLFMLFLVFIRFEWGEICGLVVQDLVWVRSAAARNTRYRTWQLSLFVAHARLLVSVHLNK